MRGPSDSRRWALAGLAWLAVFSLLFTGGSAIGLWPLAPGAEWGRLDLPIGLGFGAAVCLALLRKPKMPRPLGPEA